MKQRIKYRWSHSKSRKPRDPYVNPITVNPVGVSIKRSVENVVKRFGRGYVFLSDGTHTISEPVNFDYVQIIGTRLPGRTTVVQPSADFKGDLMFYTTMSGGFAKNIHIIYDKSDPKKNKRIDFKELVWEL